MQSQWDKKYPDAFIKIISLLFSKAQIRSFIFRQLSYMKLPTLYYIFVNSLCKNVLLEM